MKKKILVCPLNWGLGHATRDVPLIQRFLNEGHEVVVACDGFPLKFLRQQFPYIPTIEYASYPVRYSRSNTQIFAFIGFLPKMLQCVYKEHLWLSNLLQKEHFDMVVSDNRFGLWNKHVHSVYVTHQIMIKMPAGLKSLEPMICRIHKKFIEKYDECWVPDYEKNGGLSGDLAHKYPTPKNAKFVGMMSRFDKLKEITPDCAYDTVVILSGVEPQRSIFEKKMLGAYEHHRCKTLMLVGKPTKEIEIAQRGNVTLCSHLPDDKLAAAFIGSKKIICRAGYTTLMDLEVLGCLSKAEFFPTPGQTEQEYLAEYLTNK